jgi:hypothetical protein
VPVVEESVLRFRGLSHLFRKMPANPIPRDFTVFQRLRGQKSLISVSLVRDSWT